MARGERPLEGEDGPVLRFAADLRALREKAGRPAYRELSKRAHYSTGALSDAAGGRRLPSLAVTLAYVGACGGDTEAWERRWREVAAELDAESADPVGDDGEAPYVGLAPFGVEDADRFFGRERLVTELAARVADQRFVVVFGPSGSGKSSLLRAGLVSGAAGPVLLMTPGQRPLQECAARLACLVGGSAIALRAAMGADDDSLHLTALQALVSGQASSDLLVVVDQFEEVFTLCRDADERARFLAVLRAAAHAPNSRTRVVLGVRADFYAHCAHHPELVEAIRDGQFLVGPMTTDELRTAITRPAVEAGCRLETALVSRVIADATGRPGVLPLVSHALLETWKRRRGTTLTSTGYDAAGGITEAVARTAAAVHASLSPRQRQWSRQLFLRLVALGEGTEDTKRRVDRAELDLDADGALVLERLVRARLVTRDRDSVQITHEALIRCWPQLRHWLTEDRETLRVHRQLVEATATWESLDRDPGALYRGARLALARELADSAVTLTARERAFLDASLAAEAAERAAARRRTRRLRQLVAVLAVLLVLSTASTVYAIRADIAVSRQRNALLAQEVTKEAVALRATNPALAAQLGLAAYRLVPSRQARDGLISTLAVPLAGHTQVVSSVAFAPDRRHLATAGFEGSVWLWDIGEPVLATPVSSFAGNCDSIATVAFSPDGALLALGCRDHTVRLWNVADPQRPAEVATLVGHTDVVFSVVFAPDGRTLASGSYDRSVRLWDVADSARPAPLSALIGHTLNVKPVAFSPDGKTLASGGDDRTVRLWDTGDPARPVELAVLTGHDDFVSAVAFSPDGRTLASGSDDHTVRLWDVGDRRRPTSLTTLAAHSDIVGSVAFSPDGTTLATGGYDQTVRLWDLAERGRPTERATLTGHAGAINSTAFSPDGRTLATGSDDHIALLWETDGDRVEARACAVGRPAISPDEWERHLPGLDYQPPCP
ncbi:WD domain-containing protein, G-beta repeat-containing protein [Actinokineospora iranica]|uniref:WD domain-containing protein, G-beta repeat-containing protein n=1 Tax=Actinokineospora iranica TaxID=1271860 RepID=A0A1G6S1N1_9PSEU|nr:WD domain-containing protein, G-beta repeat-containing protein [Actinokineospora iranica]